MPKNYCLLILLLLAAFTTQAQKKTDVKGYPIIINRDTLFTFYAGQGLFEPAERAAIVTKRIEGLVNRIDFNADSLTLKNDTAVSVIAYNSQIILAVNNKDATFSELPRAQLAASYLDILKKKLGNYFTTNNTKQMVINILQAIAVVILVIALIWALNKGSRWVKLRVLRTWENRMDKLAAQGAPVKYAKRLLPLITSLLRIARFILIIIVVYLALPVLFFIFPSSKPIASQLLSYVVNPFKSILLALVHYIPNLLTIAVIYVVTRYIVKLVKFIANEIALGAITINSFYPEWAMPTYNIIRVLLYAFMFVVIFPYLPGSDSKIFQGVTVFLGVLFSLGSSSAISNMVAGIVLTYMRPYKVGDRIKVGDAMGDVVEKNLLVTRLRTIKNEDITIPNGTILSGHTTNYSTVAKTMGLILNTTVTIGYDVPWQTVHNLLISAAEATEGVSTEQKPFVLQTALNDFNVSYQVNAYTPLSNQMAGVYSRLHQNIQDKFNEAGVEIMSPHYTALRDGNHIQIPADYVPEDYKKPGFKVEGE
ncbi:mechanosensitive ion channel family protein [Mucilaginibacter sabulilitoris]|uniref:Mechanosensitive ion channel family protein n=1 Tax=Mucilaginibacter sabulilitoris TaxID=1173583 RepID=A0ABZ0TJV6_9SPHI|nr:mechanosensitive ion channel family protein [Mucilaginibacter sabulilitoris]WPU93449.1 mechanosensitive ion channel family protein [Mucilaginibacter sabulilitoris]